MYSSHIMDQLRRCPLAHTVQLASFPGWFVGCSLALAPINTRVCHHILLILMFMGSKFSGIH